MDKWVLNRYFYKTINFWLGVVFGIGDVYGIIQGESDYFTLSLDIIGAMISLALILSSLIKRNPEFKSK